MNAIRLLLNNLILFKNRLEAQLTANSQRLMLNNKQQSNASSSIRFKYTQEKDLVQNNIDKLGEKKSSDEYKEMMEELKELNEKEESELKAQEDTAADAEAEIQAETDSLETQLEETEQEIESYSECEDQDIEKSFKYAE